MLLFFLILYPLNTGLCLDSRDVISLKNAGIGSETIQLIIREKAVETCLLTVDDILDLRKAGLSNETIQLLIKEGSFLKDSKPLIYGKEIRSIKFTTAKDIIELKDAGLSDEIIKAIIIHGSKDADDEARKKAWDVLRDMEILIDQRE
jgi:hypothetical protein